MRAAGSLKNRAYLFALIRALGNPQLRGDAIDGAGRASVRRSCGTLSDVLLDESRADAHPPADSARSEEDPAPALGGRSARRRRASGSHDPRGGVKGVEPAAGDRADAEFRKSVRHRADLERGAPLLRAERGARAVPGRDGRRAHRRAAARAHDRGAAEGHARAPVPAARAALSAEGDLFGVPRGLAPAARRGDRRAGVPGQHAGAQHQAHPAAAAGRAGAPARARQGAVRRRGAHARRTRFAS